MLFKAYQQRLQPTVFQCANTRFTRGASNEPRPRAFPRTSSRRGQLRRCCITGSRATRRASAPSAASRSRATTASRGCTADGVTSRCTIDARVTSAPSVIWASIGFTSSLQCPFAPRCSIGSTRCPKKSTAIDPSTRAAALLRRPRPKLSA